MYLSKRHVYCINEIYQTIMNVLGWTEVDDLAYSMIAKDISGTYKITRTVVISTDLSWHVQVRAHNLMLL